MSLFSSKPSKEELQKEIDELNDSLKKEKEELAKALESIKKLKEEKIEVEKNREKVLNEYQLCLKEIENITKDKNYAKKEMDRLTNELKNSEEVKKDQQKELELLKKVEKLIKGTEYKFKEMVLEEEIVEEIAQASKKFSAEILKHTYEKANDALQKGLISRDNLLKSRLDQFRRYCYSLYNDSVPLISYIKKSIVVNEEEREEFKELLKQTKILENYPLETIDESGKINNVRGIIEKLQKETKNESEIFELNKSIVYRFCVLMRQLFETFNVIEWSLEKIGKKDKEFTQSELDYKPMILIFTEKELKEYREKLVEILGKVISIYRHHHNLRVFMNSIHYKKEGNSSWYTQLDKIDESFINFYKEKVNLDTELVKMFKKAEEDYKKNHSFHKPF